MNFIPSFGYATRLKSFALDFAEMKVSDKILAGFDESLQVSTVSFHWLTVYIGEIETEIILWTEICQRTVSA